MHQVEQVGVEPTTLFLQGSRSPVKSYSPMALGVRFERTYHRLTGDFIASMIPENVDRGIFSRLAAGPLGEFNVQP